MSVITIRHKGGFTHLEKFFNAVRGKRYLSQLDELAQIGVEALAASTPVNTGKTAASWTYEITESDGQTTIQWLNSNVNNNVNIAVILQYGHATGNGGYVQGIDYINPALKPVFEMIAEKSWKEVTRI